ncbi:MAG TPA: dihydrofolate reductase family protein, partial [Nocardioides sp.]|nr:dihydrofolate reductase family protein [Nocardioides sp.]
MSLDGFLDDASDERLLLSNDADFDRVDEVRAGADAILVGAATVRNDDPRLLVRHPDRVARRRTAGRP